MSPIKNSDFLEILCIDNNSSDSTCDILESEYPKVKLIRNDHNLGFGKASNKGFQYFLGSRHNYVFLLNQDARIDEEGLLCLMHRMDENPQYGVLSPVHRAEDSKKLDYYFSLYLNVKNTPDLLDDFILGRTIRSIYPTQFVNAALWLLRRECVEKVGIFDPVFPHYGEDDDYVRRVLRSGYEIGVVPTVFANHARKDPRQSEASSEFGAYRRKQYVSLLLKYKYVHGSMSRRLAVLSRDFFLAIIQSVLTLRFYDSRSALINYPLIAVNIGKKKI